MKKLLARRQAPTIVLMLATLVWGTSFVITRHAVQNIPPLAFVAVRFAIATLTIAILTRPDLRRIAPVEWRGGAALSLAMCGGYGMQAVGMHLGITSGRAAFISALYVPMVPLLQMLILRRQPGPRTWIGLAFACAGLMLMSGPIGATHAGPAEALVLAGAVAIAAEILLIGVYAPHVNASRLAILECAGLACLCAAITTLSGQSWPAPHPAWLLSAIALGFGSAGLQIAVNWAQRSVPPARATLIYTMEPVWAAAFGLLAGETMKLTAIAGAGLILISLLISKKEESVLF